MQRNQRSNCQHLLDHRKKQGNSRKTSTSASLTALKPLTVWITTNCGKFLEEMGSPDHLTCLLRNLYAGQETTVRNGPVQNWERTVSRLYIVTVCLTYIHHVKSRAGWIIGWNQDCREKYQQPQICRWNHSNGRKWGRTKEPLDKGEKGEWKSSVKTQLLENSDHGMWSHHFMAYRWGNNGNSDKLYFLGLQNHCGRWQQPCD